MCDEIVNSSNSLKRPPLLSNVLLLSQDHASLIEESPNLKLVFPTTIVLRVPSVSCWRQCGLFLASERVAGDLRCCGSILGSSLPVLRHQRQHRFCDVTPRAAATRSSLGFRIGGGRVGRPSRALLVARGRPLGRLRFIARIKTGPRCSCWVGGVLARVGVKCGMDFERSSSRNTGE